jgi:hypothetical protein
MMDDLPDTIERLGARLETLERRVYALEHPHAAAAQPPAQTSSAATAPAATTIQLPQAGGVFSVLGKAMLGIAGAYLLRAVAETNIAPQAVVATIAIIYAILWLIWAARTPSGVWFASATYACTSALILSPMLWELTLRFKVLPAPATAVALAAFSASAFALTWKQNHVPVLWIATFTASGLAVALSIASHQIVPFAAVLLLIVALSECGVAFNRWGNVRILAAAAADLAIWLLIYINSSPQNTRLDYPILSTPWLLAPGIALFLIFAAAVTFKTVLRRKSITVFETIQTTIAFLLASSSLLYFGPPASAAFLGILCLLLSAWGYAAAFTLFSGEKQPRNNAVFATWSAALFLAASVLCIPAPWISACLGTAAVVATIAGARTDRIALEFHGAAYLLAAAISSGLLIYLFQSLAGTLPGAPSWRVSFIAACAVLCFAATKSCPGESWKPQALYLLFAFVAAAAATALLVKGLASFITLWMQSGAHHLAFIRTLVLCAAALMLAFGGAFWHRLELTRVGYAALALVAIKLVLEDLPLGHLGYIAASIFLFALTLIAVPRAAHLRHRT